MNITNFEQTGLNQVADWLEKNKHEQFDERTYKEVLKTSNIFFVAEGINRIASMLLCELKASYIQQSQRYVTMTEDGFIFPELDASDTNTAKELIAYAFELYSKMSELKAGDFKGRPKPENYIHGIPIEDARYILPLATKTNICVSMSGDQLYELFRLFANPKYKSIFAVFKEQMETVLPAQIVACMPTEAGSDLHSENIESLFKPQFEKISSDTRMVLLDSFNNLDLQVGLGALTSTQSKTSSQILEAWGMEATEEANKITKRVLGYGHDSIAEQARTTFGMMCSLAAYHQQVRHRLPESYREDLSTIVIDKERPIAVPPTIKESVFYDEYVALVEDFREFRNNVIRGSGEDKSYPFLLNTDQIKIIISTNARMDAKMLSERTCMNSQWEIRELAVEKLTILRGLSDVLYEKALPSCVLGKCKEGKLSCGQQKQVKDMFAGMNNQ